ncbi:MAG: MaoC family dehydratase [Ramlibacter sp.]|jgi:hypothetical protein|nr:MaoC family dehydratase [Ramlibacter sp.]
MTIVTLPAQGPVPQRRFLPFADVEVGYCFPREQLTFSQAEVDAFEACLALPPSQFHGSAPLLGSPPRRLVPLFLLNEFFSMKRHIMIPNGTLHAQEHLELASPLFVGETFDVDVRITDKYVRNEKKFVTMQQLVSRRGEAQPALKVVRLFNWAQ